MIRRLLRAAGVARPVQFHSSSVVTSPSSRWHWQWPAATEQAYFYNHLFQHPEASDNASPRYVGVPWATIIDSREVGEFCHSSAFSELRGALGDRGRRYYTVCQHIHWRELVDAWLKLGITDVCLSHFDTTVHDLPGLRFHSWPLLAANYEADERSQGLRVVPPASKRHLASFIGSHAAYYPDDTRLKLQALFARGHHGVIVELRDEWFYGPMVYPARGAGETLAPEYCREVLLRTVRYNEILSDSVFSLCPAGTGPNTIRLWESMAVGSIPVVFSDTWVPPTALGFDWDSLAIFVKRAELPETIDRLRSISPSQRERMSLNCINAYHSFRTARCFRLKDQLNHAGYQPEGECDHPPEAGEGAAKHAAASRA